ncbi:MAG TPA: polysaccharide deacetylase family protein [Gaiellaceae bacterium]
MNLAQPHLMLAYHAVSSTWPSSLAIPEKILAAQLAFLRGRGFTGLTFAEAERRLVAGTLPPRSVVVTFDDGYLSILRAKPILERFGFPATVFVVTAFVESGEPLRWFGVESWLSSPYAPEMASLRWSDLEDLVDAGWEVGSHTHTHSYLPLAPDDVLQDELTRSREAIASRLGECETLAYPYGRTDARVAEAAEACGYAAACALSSVHWGAAAFRRARLALLAADTGIRLRIKLSPPAAFVHRSRLAYEAQRAWRGIHPHRDWFPSGSEPGHSKAEPGPPR